MKKQLLTILVVSMCILFSFQASAAEEVVLASLDWEPYIGQNLQNHGYVAELVREAFKRQGYQLVIKYLPWARVIKMAKAGRTDGYFPEYYSAELSKDYLVSSPFPGGPLGFYKRKGEAISFSRLEDLSTYQIAVVRGYVNTKEFDEATFLQKQEAVDDLTNFKKLLKNRVDLVVADKFVGRYVMTTNLPGEFDKVEFMEPPLENKDLYVCISRKADNAQTLYQAFEAGLKEIKEDGTVAAILRRHGF